MSDPVIIAAIVGLVSAVVTSVIGSWLAYRKIRTELTGNYRLELIRKQIEACEKLWSGLAPVSMYPGRGRIIIEQSDGFYVQVGMAQELTDRLVELFYTPAGLYFSRPLRRDFFGLMDFIRDEFLKEARPDEDLLKISNSKHKNFRHMVHRLLGEIRKEIGMEDLSVGKTGPIE